MERERQDLQEQIQFDITTIFYPNFTFLIMSV